MCVIRCSYANTDVSFLFQFPAIWKDVLTVRAAACEQCWLWDHTHLPRSAHGHRARTPSCVCPVLRTPSYVHSPVLIEESRAPLVYICKVLQVLTVEAAVQDKAAFLTAIRECFATKRACVLIVDVALSDWCDYVQPFVNECVMWVYRSCARNKSVHVCLCGDSALAYACVPLLCFCLSCFACVFDVFVMRGFTACV